jgi:hypothetical protein
MANYFYVFAAEDAHIEFLKNHPPSVANYVSGEKPDVAVADVVPSNWPGSALEPIGFTDAIHRNVDLYHWILNAKPDSVSGSGSLFQTWFTSEHSAIELDGESFAFMSDQVHDLAVLVNKVDVPSVLKVFTAWCDRKGKNYVPDAAECESLVDEFKTFGQNLEGVMAKGLGLVWVPC